MRIFVSFLIFLSGFSLLLLPACANDTSGDTPAGGETGTTTASASSNPTGQETGGSEPFIAEEDLYAWVDNLNIRDAPSLDGKVVAKAAGRDPLRFTGEHSDAAETIVLRGLAYREPWLKVVTPNGTEGWVFGGAVKHEDEVKGNRPITEQTFHFPVFGSYDLPDWEKVSEKQEGEEVDYTIKTYQKGDQLLEITQAEMGEFYYGWTYKLMREDGTLLKERQFGFTAQESPFLLEESVKDFTVDPPVVYRRSQTLDQHYYRLNARPMMVNAPWEKEKL